MTAAEVAGLRFQQEAWMTEALCRLTPGWLEMPVTAQLSDCGRCPVAGQCLSYALRIEPTKRDREFSVVFGGLRGADRALLIGPPRAPRGGRR